MKIMAILIFACLVVISVPTIGSSAPTGTVMEIEDTFLYLQEDDSLSPQLYPDATVVQRVEAQYDEIPLTGVRTNRQFVTVGVWDYTMEAPITVVDETPFVVFWWAEVDEGYDNDPEFSVTVHVGDGSGTQNENGPTGVAVTTPRRTEIFVHFGDQQLEEGDVISVEIEYSGWEDMDLYYRSGNYSSGFMIRTDALRIYRMDLVGNTVNLLMSDHFYIDWRYNNLCYCAVIGMNSMSDIFDNDSYFMDPVSEFVDLSEYGIDLNFTAMVMSWEVELKEGEITIFTMLQYNNLSWGHLGYKNFTVSGSDDDGFLEGIMLPLIGIGVIAVVASLYFFKIHGKSGVEEVEVIQEE